MLRGMLSRLTGRATRPTTARPAPGAGTAGRGAADREIARGAGSLLRGLSRKRRV